MMAAPIRDDTDTALVRFFRTRRRAFFAWLGFVAAMLAIGALLPWLVGPLS